MLNILHSHFMLKFACILQPNKKEPSLPTNSNDCQRLYNTMTGSNSLNTAFVSPLSLPLSNNTATSKTFLTSSPASTPNSFRKRARSSTTFQQKRNNDTVTTKMILDPETVGTGYAFLESLRGVVIGPTVNEVMAAFCGGTVGVMTTIIILEVRRQKVKERKQCPYCHGTGKLPCGTCYSVGSIPSANFPSAQEACAPCVHTGYIECNHCEGDGRLIPWVYERAMRSQYEDYIYTAVDDYYQDQPPYL